jgi:hypothetical protein
MLATGGTLCTICPTLAVAAPHRGNEFHHIRPWIQHNSADERAQPPHDIKSTVAIDRVGPSKLSPASLTALPLLERVERTRAITVHSPSILMATRPIAQQHTYAAYLE